MADLFNAVDAVGATVPILTDQVTDGVLGTGQKQLVGVVDATIDGTNKMIVDAAGAARVQPKLSATATKANISGSVTTVTLIASNTARLGATVFNDSTSAMYVNLGSSASTSAFVVKLASMSYWEVPFGYTGAINGIWDTAAGAARVCEMS